MQYSVLSGFLFQQRRHIATPEQGIAALGSEA
jgi:hypothetical protein